MATKRYRKKSGTRRRHSTDSSSLVSFQKEITLVFLEILIMIKLYHWKTTSYAAHKATDELYGKFNEHMDRFIEVLLGKNGSRVDLMNHKQIKLIDLSSSESLKREIDGFKGYLVSLDENKALQGMSNADLYTIRDEILADLNQFLYLLTFK
jgi:hypothetical protein